MGNEASTAPELRAGRAWAIGLGVLFATAITRTLAMAAVASAVGADVESSDPAVRHDGLLIGAGILAGSIVGLGTVALLAPRALLGLVRPTPAQLALWLALGAALAAAFDVAAWALGRPLVEAAWVDAYRTAPVALLALALTATSIFEELYFRGFLQGALVRTRLGRAGAIGVTALLFALAHFPDDVWRFVDVLCAGILLGVARDRTGSTVPGMAPHVLGNLKVLVVLALTV